jgi:hypothetical protein
MKEADEDVLVARCDAADKAWAELPAREPQPETWGMYSYGDAPPAIGGGVGAFVWFETREELLAFVGSVLPFSPPGPSNRDFLKVESDARALVAEVRSVTCDLECVRERLNGVLSDFSRIEWWGQFHDLCAGRHPYAQAVIASFRESLAEDGEDTVVKGPIREDELGEFKLYLETYGL